MLFWITSSFVLAIVGFFFCVDVGVRRSQKRSLEILGNSHCPSCDATFGMAAAVAARENYLISCLEMQKKNPGMRFRFSGRWTVACPACGKECEFDSQKNLLVAK